MMITPHGKPVEHVAIHPPMVGRPDEALGSFYLDVGKVALVAGESLAQPPPQGEWQGCWLSLFERAHAPA
jgi:hypothetical protein